MYETKQQITQRKIRNGLRKQAEAIQRKKEKVWDILKQDTSKGTVRRPIDNDVGCYYCPYVPIMKKGKIIIGYEATA